MDFKEHVSKTTHLSLNTFIITNNKLINIFIANLWEEIKISLRNFVKDSVTLIILIILAVLIIGLYFFGKYKNRMVKLFSIFFLFFFGICV